MFVWRINSLSLLVHCTAGKNDLRGRPKRRREIRQNISELNIGQNVSFVVKCLFISAENYTDLHAV